jgi:hypothetical protein
VVSRSGISLWAHSLATVGIAPTFSAKREEVEVRECWRAGGAIVTPTPSRPGA